ncbi:MAG: hypothetical protein Q6352_000010 [Candidatus Freyrarchaeum guaymaensis]
MITDEEIEKIRRMSKEEKMDYLESRIEEMLSEIPEEDKEAMMSAGPMMMEKLLSDEGMELMEQMFSSITEEDIPEAEKLAQSTEEGEPADIGRLVGASMELVGRIMERMMSEEGFELLGRMMELMGDPEKMEIFTNLSQESQEKLRDIRKLSLEIMSELSPEDYAELTRRIQKIYDKYAR